MRASRRVGIRKHGVVVPSGPQVISIPGSSISGSFDSGSTDMKINFDWVVDRSSDSTQSWAVFALRASPSWGGEGYRYQKADNTDATDYVLTVNSYGQGNIYYGLGNFGPGSFEVSIIGSIFEIKKNGSSIFSGYRTDAEIDVPENTYVGINTAGGQVDNVVVTGLAV